MLTRLYFKNWRSLREQEIPNLTPITVFIGANSSGKSNIVEGLHFLRRMAIGGIFGYGGRYSNWRDPNNPIKYIKAGPDENVVVSFSFKPALEDLTLTYTLTNIGKPELGPGELGRYGLVFQESLKDQDGKPWLTNDGRIIEATGPSRRSNNVSRDLGLSVFGRQDEFPQIQKTFNFVSDRWQVLEPDFLPPSELSIPAIGFRWSPFDIAPNAENVLAMLKHMKDYRADLYKELQDDLGWLLSFVSGFNVESEELRLRLKMYERGLGELPAPTVSSGTARLLAMLTAYYALDMLNAEQPGLVVIEEPDTAIHPLLLRNFVELLRTYTSREGYPRQFILTTHNPMFLNLFNPEEVRIVERDDGVTSVNPVDEDVAKVWLEHDGAYNLGDLWTTRLLGGVPE